MTNVHGFSSYQMVFGFNPKFPNILINRLPALEKPNISKLVADNLNAMCSARKAFVANESSEKLNRAFKHNLRTYQDAIFATGDTVYYKRRDSKKWKGPGKVIGVDDQQILIKHGSTYVRCHPSHAILRDITEKGVPENRKSYSDLKEKTNNDLKKAYEDRSDSSQDNINDNYDSDEEDFPSEQADDQNIQNPQLNLEHTDDQQVVDQPTQNP